jgi:hypothetical protein
VNCRWHIFGAPATTITLFVALLAVTSQAHAIDQVQIENLQAAMRTLSFLESLPKEGPIVVGVVYAADVPSAEALATETAKVIGTIRGPNSRILQPLVLSTSKLTQFSGHLDVIYLLAGTSRHSDAIVDVMRRYRIVSISDDLACIDAKCCVLMVRTGQRVEITLNTALADGVGARFSRVFTMVVKRK